MKFLGLFLVACSLFSVFMAYASHRAYENRAYDRWAHAHNESEVSSARMARNVHVLFGLLFAIAAIGVFTDPQTVGEWLVAAARLVERMMQ